MMIPGYIQEGTFAGHGVFFVGLEERISSPFECSVEIMENRESFLVSGYYQHPSTIDRRSFSASLSKPRASLASLTVGALDLSDATLGELTGVLSTSGTSVLIQARSNDFQTQISQRWDGLHQDHRFHVHGVVVQDGKPPIHYSLSFGNVDPRLAKSNVLALGDSA